MTGKRKRNSQICFRISEETYYKFMCILEDRKQNQREFLMDLIDGKIDIKVIDLKEEIKTIKDFLEEFKVELRPILYGPERYFVKNFDEKIDLLYSLFVKFKLRFFSSFREKNKLRSSKQNRFSDSEKNKKINIRLTEDEKKKVENYLDNVYGYYRNRFIYFVVNDKYFFNNNDYVEMISLLDEVDKYLNKIQSRSNLLRHNYSKIDFASVDVYTEAYEKFIINIYNHVS